MLLPQLTSSSGHGSHSSSSSGGGKRAANIDADIEVDLDLVYSGGVITVRSAEHCGALGCSFVRSRSIRSVRPTSGPQRVVAQVTAGKQILCPEDHSKVSPCCEIKRAKPDCARPRGHLNTLCAADGMLAEGCVCTHTHARTHISSQAFAHTFRPYATSPSTHSLALARPYERA